MIFKSGDTYRNSAISGKIRQDIEWCHSIAVVNAAGIEEASREAANRAAPETGSSLSSGNASVPVSWQVSSDLYSGLELSTAVSVSETGTDGEILSEYFAT